MSEGLDPRAVDDALAGLRTGFQVDGADLAVEAASPERVVVRLVLTDETCADCVVPTAMLERMVSATLRGRFPGIAQVDVIDPRP